MNHGAISVIYLALSAVCLIGLYGIYSPQVNTVAKTTFGKVDRFVSQGFNGVKPNQAKNQSNSSNNQNNGGNGSGNGQPSSQWVSGPIKSDDGITVGKYTGHPGDITSPENVHISKDLLHANLMNIYEFDNNGGAYLKGGKGVITLPKYLPTDGTPIDINL